MQFSYPQIFLDPSEQIHVKVDDHFSNTEVFRMIQRWMRDATSPIRINGKAFPIRLGKKSRSWIHEHHQLTGYAIS